MVDLANLRESLQEKFQEDFLGITEFRAMATVHIRSPRALDLMHLLKTDPRYGFNFLSDLTAVDHLESGGHERFCVVYHLLNQHLSHRIVIRAWVDETKPELPSVYTLWKTADWQEREVYDLFGITFTGHPNLIRIMNPDSFRHHPLRKDYPLHGKGERARFPVYKRDIGSRWRPQGEFE